MSNQPKYIHCTLPKVLLNEHPSFDALKIVHILRQKGCFWGKYSQLIEAIKTMLNGFNHGCSAY
jgi:hypothetical protein